MDFKIKMLAVVLFFAVGQKMAAQTPIQKVAPADSAAVQKILDEYVAAWLRGDEKGVLDPFEQRGRIQPSGMCPFDSLQNIRKFWFPTDGSTTTIHQFDLELQDMHALGSDLIFTAQTSRLYWSYHLGDSRAGKLQYGYATTVFRKQTDGQWKIWRQAWTDLKNVNTRPVPLGEQPLKIAHEILENDLVPEGLAHDAATGDLFVSSTWKKKIVKISPDGRAADFVKSGQEGLLGVIGMKVDAERRLLWVATASAGKSMPVEGWSEAKNTKSGILQFDLKTGKCLRQFWLEEKDKSFFFNDLDIDKAGRVYATEMTTQRIYSIAPGSSELEIFLQLPDRHTPNGIALDDSEQLLFVGLYTRPESFGRVDLKSKKLDFVALPAGEAVGADGLYFHKNSLIAVQPWAKDRVLTQYFLDEKLEKVEQMKVLLPDDPSFAQPSTGAVAGDRFFFIATSQLQAFAKHFRENGGRVFPEKLLPVKIGVLDLREYR
jgi:sugar lactone lactonase YvrE/ketosteroid isomerase-like protein